jgi:hypothetical protein
VTARVRSKARARVVSVMVKVERIDAVCVCFREIAGEYVINVERTFGEIGQDARNMGLSREDIR